MCGGVGNEPRLLSRGFTPGITRMRDQTLPPLQGRVGPILRKGSSSCWKVCEGFKACLLAIYPSLPPSGLPSLLLLFPNVSCGFQIRFGAGEILAQSWEFPVLPVSFPAAKAMGCSGHTRPEEEIDAQMMCVALLQPRAIGYLEERQEQSLSCIAPSCLAQRVHGGMAWERQCTAKGWVCRSAW